MQSTKEKGGFEDAVLELYAWIASGKEDGKYRNCGDSHILLLPLYHYNFLTSSEIFPFFRFFGGNHSQATVTGGHVNSSDGDGGTATARGRRIQGVYGQEAAMVGGSTGSGDSGNNGGSRTPSGQGGGALIPVYVAGAANNRHHKHHRGSANRNQNSIGLSTLIVATLASLLADLYH